MRTGRWVSREGLSTCWHGQWQWRRLQVGYRVHRHGSANPNLGDRWVLHPSLVWDRRP